MGAYIIRRTWQTVIVLLLVSIIVFGAIHLIPGDAITAKAGDTHGMTAERLAQLRHEWGLDRPVYEQYLTWIGNLLRGDMGISYQSEAPVSFLIASKLPATLELAAVSLIISALVGILGGIIGAVKQNSILDYGVTSFVVLAMAVPAFWGGIMLIYLFAVYLKWLPSGGYVPLLEDVGANLKHLILPATTLGLLISAYTMRVVRSALLDEMGKDYVRTARSKGLAEKVVIYRHALRNALIPAVTMLGVNLSYLLGGVVTIEFVFHWPGIGWLTVGAIRDRDYFVLQGAVLLVAAFVILVNLVVDILYAVIDPRIRYDR